MIGTRYESLLAATQIAVGSNYRYVCNATVSGQATNSAMVTIFEPLSGQGEPVIRDIRRF